MDFFEHQDAARQSSKKLVWLFVLAVAVIALLVATIAGGTVLLIAAKQGHGLSAESVSRLPLWESCGLAVAATLLSLIHI